MVHKIVICFIFFYQEAIINFETLSNKNIALLFHTYIKNIDINQLG